MELKISDNGEFLVVSISLTLNFQLYEAEASIPLSDLANALKKQSGKKKKAYVSSVTRRKHAVE